MGSILLGVTFLLLSTEVISEIIVIPLSSSIAQNYNAISSVGSSESLQGQLLFLFGGRFAMYYFHSMYKVITHVRQCIYHLAFFCTNC